MMRGEKKIPPKKSSGGVLGKSLWNFLDSVDMEENNSRSLSKLLLLCELGNHSRTSKANVTISFHSCPAQRGDSR